MIKFQIMFEGNSRTGQLLVAGAFGLSVLAGCTQAGTDSAPQALSETETDAVRQWIQDEMGQLQRDAGELYFPIQPMFVDTNHLARIMDREISAPDFVAAYNERIRPNGTNSFVVSFTMTDNRTGNDLQFVYSMTNPFFVFDNDTSPDQLSQPVVTGRWVIKDGEILEFDVPLQGEQFIDGVNLDNNGFVLPTNRRNYFATEIPDDPIFTEDVFVTTRMGFDGQTAFMAVTDDSGNLQILSGAEAQVFYDQINSVLDESQKDSPIIRGSSI